MIKKDPEECIGKIDKLAKKTTDLALMHHIELLRRAAWEASNPSIMHRTSMSSIRSSLRRSSLKSRLLRSSLDSARSGFIVSEARSSSVYEKKRDIKDNEEIEVPSMSSPTVRLSLQNKHISKLTRVYLSPSHPKRMNVRR